MRGFGESLERVVEREANQDGDAFKAFEVNNPDMLPVRVVYWKDD